VRSPRCDRVIASTSGSDALQKKLSAAITANIHQKPLPTNTPANTSTLPSAAICTIVVRRPVRSAICPHILGAKIRITCSSDISTPIWKALNASDCRYSPQNGDIAPTKAK